MLKALAFAALLLLLSTAACAAMSLEDYAEECGEWEDDYGDLFDGSFSGSLSASDFSDMEEAQQEWRDLSPPGEVKALHDLRTEGFDVFLAAALEWDELEDELDDLRDELDDAPRRERDDIRDEMDDVSDEQADLFDDLWEELADLSMDYQDELEDLPRRVERELESEDCI